MSLSTESMEPSSHEAFVREFARNHRRVYAYVGTLLPNPVDAEEVMQETSLVLWRKWGEFDRSADFFYWACGIAYFEVLRYRRSRKEGKLQFNDELLSQIAEEQRVQSEIQESRYLALMHCLDRLGPQDRELVEQRYREKTNIQQLAKKSNRQANTLYKTLERIRKRLLECIERRVTSEER